MFIALLVALVAVVCCAQAGPWHEVKSKKGDFTVLLPDPATTLTTTAPAEDGAIIYNDVVGTGVEGHGVKFNVVRLSRSHGRMPNSFEDMVRVYGSKGWKVTRRDLRLSGMPAVEMHFNGPVQATLRMLQRGEVVYQLIVE